MARILTLEEMTMHVSLVRQPGRAKLHALTSTVREVQAEPAGPSAHIDAAATRAAEQTERVAAIRASLRGMLNDDAHAERIARALCGLLKR